MNKRASLALRGAGAGIALMAIVYYSALHIAFVERLDAHALHDFTSLRSHPHLGGLANLFANLCNPGPYPWLAAIPVVIALYRHRRALALTVLLMLVGANLTTHFLKPLLAAHRDGQLVNGVAPGLGSWPSGHATASMTLALCFVLAVAPRWRVIAALLGSVFALGVSYSVLTLGWHYPSDVVGGLLVAGTWASLGVATLSLVQSRSRTAKTAATASEAPVTPVAAGVAGTAMLAGAITLTNSNAISYARGHEKFLAGAALIGLLAVAVATWMLLLLRRARN